MRLRQLRLAALIASLGFCAGAAFAQAYPNKMLTMIVPWPAGGATDVAGRLIANELKTSLGQNIVVENVAGAGGSIGSSKALSATADGHTLLVSSQQDVVLSPLTYKSATFKAEDAKTVALLGHTSVMIVVRKDLPANTLAELVTLMKSPTTKPLSYCTPGTGTIYPLIVERMNAMVQTKNLQVPYAGFGQCLNDVAGGVVDFSVVPIAGPFPGFVDKGSVRALAVLSDKPNPRLPTVPLANLTKGFEGFTFSLWSAVHVSAKVPDAIVEQLNKATLAALAKPEVRKTLEASGATLFDPMTVQQAHAYYLKDVKLLEALSKSVGIVQQ
jgi:tripartite-type tricarboxylate transporter receptor subunit TctC